MVLAATTPDLPVLSTLGLATQSVVLSNQALSAIVARPFDKTPVNSSGPSLTSVMFNSQTLPSVIKGVSATATNTGQGSISQAAVSISVNLALTPVSKASR